MLFKVIGVCIDPCIQNEGEAYRGQDDMGNQQAQVHDFDRAGSTKLCFFCGEVVGHVAKQKQR